MRDDTSEANLDTQPERIRSPIARGIPRLRHQVQIVAQLAKNATSTDVKTAIHDWVQHRWPDFVSLDEFLTDGFSHQRPGTRLKALTFHDEKDATTNWSFRAESPDTEIPGRSWTMDTYLIESKSGSHIGTRVLCATIPSVDVPIAKRTIPFSIRLLVRNIGIEIDNRRVSETPWLLNSQEQLNQFIALLESKERQEPIVLVSARPGRTDITGERYIVDPYELAKQCVGTAHVVAIGYDCSEAFKEYVGPEWAVFDGAVRTYHPKLDRYNDNPASHPFKSARGMMEFSSSHGDGVQGFTDFLIQHLLARTVFADGWRERMFVLHEIECLQVAQVLERNPNDVIANKNLGNLLKSELADWKSMVLGQDEEIEALKIERDAAQQEAEDARKVAFGLRARIESLEKKPTADEGNKSRYQQPRTYEDVANWVKSAFVEKLVLHPRAERAVKNATFENLALVCDAIEMLANEYHDCKMALPENREERQRLYKERQSQLGLIDEFSISPSQSGKYASEYFVEYPVGNKKKSKRPLERHLKTGGVHGGGASHDKRWDLRIYYFWDDEAKQVVIGHLPSHLTNSAT